jgi:hypothetical protein
MVKKYEIDGVENNTWIQFSESEDRKFIYILISEASSIKQRMQTGFITLDRERFNQLCDLRYNLVVESNPRIHLLDSQVVEEENA